MTCHSPSDSDFEIPVLTQEKTILVALAGQPNMGKSTLFNLLTGLNQRVGNWPGKTVERRDGAFNYEDHTYRLVDLPGSYSLTANSPEEVITREFILRENPDVVVALVSAANLERSLYLVAELVSLSAPLVVALNMMDVAEQEGIQVDADVLEAALGIPVIPMTATRAEGVHNLLDAVAHTAAGKRSTVARLPEIRADHRDALDEISRQIAGFVPEPYPRGWVALKLLEGDIDITSMMQSALPADRWKEVHALLTAHDDALLAVASGRYAWIERMVRAAVAHPRVGQISLTGKIDRWAAHPFWGLVILAVVLGSTFWLTFTVGAPLQEWLSTAVVGPIYKWGSIALSSAPAWLSGMLLDGLLQGVGTVLTFLPILIIFFAAFGFLEDVGYMARAAFVMDNTMHMMGLHGKSFLPLFLGFGCNVPAVVGTRVIDSWPARLLTILIAPLVPCTARLAVVAFLAPAFFGSQAVLVTGGLVLLSLFILVLAGVVLNRMLFRGERSAFIMEMPLYHLPNLRTIGLLVWQHTREFMRKAGTIILVVTTLVWALTALPVGNPDSSYMVQFGRVLAPFGTWMGLDWRLMVALLTSFIAKENAIATLGVLFGNQAETGLAATLASAYSPASALAFLTVSILFIPCAATMATIKQETGSWKWTLVSIALHLSVSITAAAAIYRLALLGGL